MKNYLGTRANLSDPKSGDKRVNAPMDKRLLVGSGY